MTRHTKNSLAKVKHNTLSTLKTGYSITNSRKKTTKINTLLTEILETLKTWRKHLYNIVHHALCRICCNTWTKMVGCLEIAPANVCRTELFSFSYYLTLNGVGYVDIYYLLIDPVFHVTAVGDMLHSFTNCSFLTTSFDFNHSFPLVICCSVCFFAQ